MGGAGPPAAKRIECAVLFMDRQTLRVRFPPPSPSSLPLPARHPQRVFGPHAGLSSSSAFTPASAVLGTARAAAPASAPPASRRRDSRNRAAAAGSARGNPEANVAPSGASNADDPNADPNADPNGVANPA